MVLRWLPLAGVMVVLAGCGSSSNTASSTASTSAPSANAAQGVVSSVSSINSKYGQILASSSGYVYYMFEPDTSQKSACYGACAKVWPPVTVAGSASPPVSGGVKKSLIGAITRTDGSKQITYNGHPLYTFTADSGPNLTNGEGIDHFGGYWYVLNVAGNPVTSPSSTATTAAAGAGTAY